MPRYSQEQEEYFKERIGEALVMGPGAGGRRIREYLMKLKEPIVLDIHYILRLKKTIEEEQWRSFDREKVSRRIAKMQDNINALKTRMWAILIDPDKAARDKIRAAKTILDAEFKFIHVLTAAGIFNKEGGSFVTRP